MSEPAPLEEILQRSVDRLTGEVTAGPVVGSRPNPIEPGCFVSCYGDHHPTRGVVVDVDPTEGREGKALVVRPVGRQGSATFEVRADWLSVSMLDPDLTLPPFMASPERVRVIRAICHVIADRHGKKGSLNLSAGELMQLGWLHRLAAGLATT